VIAGELIQLPTVTEDARVNISPEGRRDTGTIDTLGLIPANLQSGSIGSAAGKMLFCVEYS
jgi:hypothetical protein